MTNPFKEKTLACEVIKQNEKGCVCGGKDKSNQPLSAYVNSKTPRDYVEKDDPKQRITSPAPRIYWKHKIHFVI